VGFLGPPLSAFEKLDFESERKVLVDTTESPHPFSSVTASKNRVEQYRLREGELA
jgi:hypothetical protein